MAEVTWTPAAVRQWQAIVDFVARSSPKRAEKLADRLRDAPEKLALFPKMGRRVPELKRDDLRELVTVRPYRIVYLLLEDGCLVVAILDSRRDFWRAWQEEGLLDDI